MAKPPQAEAFTFQGPAGKLEALLELPGVASVFMTADFVTLNKLPEAAWDPIIDAAKALLETHFDTT